MNKNMKIIWLFFSVISFVILSLSNEKLMFLNDNKINNASKPKIRILSSEFDRSCWTLEKGLKIIVNYTLEEGEITSNIEFEGKYLFEIDDIYRKYAITKCNIDIESTEFICETITDATRIGFYSFSIPNDIETGDYIIYSFTSAHNQYLSSEYIRPSSVRVIKEHDYANYQGTFEIDFLDEFPDEEYTARVMFDEPFKIRVDCVGITKTKLSCQIDEDILPFNKNDRESTVTYKGYYYNICGKKEVPLEVSVKKTILPKNEIQLTYANYSCNCCKNLPWGTQMFYEYYFVKGEYTGELLVDKKIKLELIDPVVSQEVNISCTLLTNQLKCATRTSPEMLPEGSFYTILNGTYEYGDYLIDFYESKELMGVNSGYIPVKQRNIVYELDFSEGNGEIVIDFYGTIKNDTHQLKFNDSMVIVNCTMIDDDSISCPIKEEEFPCENEKVLYYGYYENICGNLDNYIYLYVSNIKKEKKEINKDK